MCSTARRSSPVVAVLVLAAVAIIMPSLTTTAAAATTASCSNPFADPYSQSAASDIACGDTLYPVTSNDSSNTVMATPSSLTNGNEFTVTQDSCY